jgi:hypothetical protein
MACAKATEHNVPTRRTELLLRNWVAGDFWVLSNFNVVMHESASTVACKVIAILLGLKNRLSHGRFRCFEFNPRSLSQRWKICFSAAENLHYNRDFVHYFK